MTDSSKTVKVERNAVTGKHKITVTVKLGQATSVFSHLTTQSSLKQDTEWCTKQALENLEAIK